MRNGVAWLCLALTCAAVVCSCQRKTLTAPWPEVAPGIALTNHIVPEKPWSVFIVRIARQDGFEIHSTHAARAAVGMSTLTEQIKDAGTNLGVTVAALNGDFYQRERAYAGDPRGLQIVDGELISAPAGTTSFWVDETGAPHVDRIASQFSVTWPDGKATAIGLNEERHETNAVLFTPAMGSSTKTTNGVEIVLERDGTNVWLPLRIGETISGRVREVRTGGNSSLTNEALVLALGTAIAAQAAELKPGAVLKFSTVTTPQLRGARTALSGGPILVRNGRAQKIDPTGLFDPKSYAAKSMFEEHPRSAIGWNENYLYLVEVDGRQKTSIGMTLEDLAKYLVKLGCTEAMNLDGGGSATLWCNGAVVNKPCDGFERPIANALLVTRKAKSP